VLVVTRRRDEAIVIGDGVEVRVLRVGRDGVRLGITAPPDVLVHRREVYDAVCAANRSAAGAGAAALERVTAQLRRQPARVPER
jgi:carbon storage regulator